VIHPKPFSFISPILYKGDFFFKNTTLNEKIVFKYIVIINSTLSKGYFL